MSALLRVGIVFGGTSSEHSVSIASAEGVAQGLDPSRFDPVLLGIGRDGRWRRPTAPSELSATIESTPWPDLTDVDVVFPVLHGRSGEDGSLQGLLELARVPYVGCGILASAASMDKAAASRLLAAAGLAVPRTLVVTAETADDLPGSDLPVFVKPNRAGSSIGVTRVPTSNDLGPAIRLALAEDSAALVQDVIPGVEIDLAVLQHPDGSLSVGAPLRVRTAHDYFDHAAKYTPGGVHFEVPALIDPAVSARLASAARLAFTTLGCDGLARVDFFVDGDRFVVNEVNTMPGMTALSQYPRIWEASGVPYREVLTTLIERALVVVR